MGDDSSGSLEGKSLANLRVVDLKLELEKRGLSRSGSKKELVKRLKQKLELEKLYESSSGTGETEPKLQLDAATEQNEFVRQYLAEQQKIYAKQKEVKRLIELREMGELDDDDESDSDVNKDQDSDVPESIAKNSCDSSTHVDNTESEQEEAKPISYEKDEEESEMIELREMGELDEDDETDSDKDQDSDVPESIAKNSCDSSTHVENTESEQEEARPISDEKAEEESEVHSTKRIEAERSTADDSNCSKDESQQLDNRYGTSDVKAEEESEEIELRELGELDDDDETDSDNKDQDSDVPESIEKNSCDSSTHVENTKSEQEEARPISDEKAEEESEVHSTKRIKAECSTADDSNCSKDESQQLGNRSKTQSERESSMVHRGKSDKMKQEILEQPVVEEKPVKYRKLNMAFRKSNGSKEKGTDRKRSWGSSVLSTTSVSISTDSLKSIIPDFKVCSSPVEETPAKLPENESEKVVQPSKVPKEEPMESDDNENLDKPPAELETPPKDKMKPVRSESFGSSSVTKSTKPASLKQTKNITNKSNLSFGSIAWLNKAFSSFRPKDKPTQKTLMPEASLKQKNVCDLPSYDVKPASPKKVKKEVPPLEAMEVDPLPKTSSLEKPQSRILFIRNLVRPFTLLQLKEVLKQTGTIVEEDFWIDKIKSKCFVTYKSEEEAISTREALHNSRWPASNPKILSVEFSNQQELDAHKGETVAPKPPPHLPLSSHRRDSSDQKDMHLPALDVSRKRDREDRERRRDHDKQRPLVTYIREWDKDKLTQDSPEREKERRRSPKRRDRSHSGERREKKKDSHKRGADEETPAKLLDDLFQKTKATPCIYWLPLTEEQVKEKEDQRKQRRLEREKRNQEQEEAERQTKRRNRRDSRSRSRSRSPARRR